MLGLNGFTAILEALQSDTPIIGVGGINTADVTSILETGISGIGVSDEITQDFNTIKIFSTNYLQLRQQKNDAIHLNN